jgi:hypothetical protein
MYIYYAPRCIRYRECTHAQLTEPSQSNQASTGRVGGGAGAEPMTAATAHHSLIHRGNRTPLRKR